MWILGMFVNYVMCILNYVINKYLEGEIVMNCDVFWVFGMIIFCGKDVYFIWSVFVWLGCGKNVCVVKRGEFKFSWWIILRVVFGDYKWFVKNYVGFCSLFK